MSEERKISPRYRKIARRLIEKEPLLELIKNSSVRICFLASDREKKSNGKTVYAECEKVPDKWLWSVPYDFTITVFEPNVERFSRAQLRILLLHELLHIGIEQDGNEERYFVVPHDIEDFGYIIRRFGMDWNE